MARAGRIPNERMVRSSTVPSASTATPSLRTQPSAWWTAPWRRTAAPPRRAPRRPPPSPTPPRRHAHRGAGPGPLRRPVTVTGRPGPTSARAPGLGGGEEHGGLGPPRPPEGADTGGPGSSTSSTTRPGPPTRPPFPVGQVDAAHASGHPHHTAPVEFTPAAIGGRLGPVRTTSSRASTTRTQPARVIGQRSGPRRPPERRACPRRPRRWPAGWTPAPPRHAPRGVGLQVGRLGEGGPAASGPSRRRATSRGWPTATVELRPGTFPARARASPRVSPTIHPPAPSGTATKAPDGAVSSANPPPPTADVGSRPPGRTHPRSGPAGPRPPGRAQVGGPAPAPGPVP